MMSTLVATMGLGLSLAAGNTDSTIKINFQPADMAVPVGYIADLGQIYGDRGNGFKYGWGCDFTADSRDRFYKSTRDSTLVIIDRMSVCSNDRWEMEVPSGRYEVEIGYSDIQFGVRTGGCKIEGNNASAGAVGLEESPKTVKVYTDVIDGRLTLTGSFAGADLNGCNSVSFIHIKPIFKPIGAPAEPKWNAKINFQPADMAVPEGYISDSGQIYGDRGNGFTYGWGCDFTGDSRDRFYKSTRDSSLVIIDRMSVCSNDRWEMDVPSGRYEVEIGYSDIQFGVRTGSCQIEGKSASVGSVGMEESPKTFKMQTDVFDGRLTLTGSFAGADPNGCNSVSFIHIRRMDPCGIVHGKKACEVMDSCNWTRPHGAPVKVCIRHTCTSAKRRWNCEAVDCSWNAETRECSGKERRLRVDDELVAPEKDITEPAAAVEGSLVPPEF